MNIDLAIKFGSSEIIIYRKGQGIIAKEPAFLAVTPSKKKVKVRAVGKNAEKLKSANIYNTLVYQPIVNSEVVDEKLATILIRKILEKTILDKFRVQKVSALVAVPCATDIHQLNKLKTVLMKAGINKINFVQNGVCVREYEESLDEYDNCLVVDIGKYITDFSILNKFAFVSGRDYKIGGADMDNSLVTYIKDNFNLDVTPAVAEEVKNKVASLYNNDMYSTEFQGISEEKVYETQKIIASEVKVAIVGVYDKICNLILEYVKAQPKELTAEIFKNGVIFSGGGAKIQGLYEYAHKKLEMPVIILDNPVDAVVLGCAKLLDKPIKSILKINF